MGTPYTITRQDGGRDLEALKAILDNDGIVDGDVDVLHQIAEAIEEQVPSTVKDPVAFGSIVRAGLDGLSDRVLWSRAAGSTWFSEDGTAVGSFSFLDHPEVLRVGIGETPMTEEEIDESQATAQRNIQKWEPINAHESMTKAGFDPTPAQDDAYLCGRTDLAVELGRQLRKWRSEAITSERQSAYDNAIALVDGELA